MGPALLCLMVHTVPPSKEERRGAQPSSTCCQVRGTLRARRPSWLPPPGPPQASPQPPEKETGFAHLEQRRAATGWGRADLGRTGDKRCRSTFHAVSSVPGDTFLSMVSWKAFLSSLSVLRSWIQARLCPHHRGMMLRARLHGEEGARRLSSDRVGSKPKSTAQQLWPGHAFEVSSTSSQEAPSKKAGFISTPSTGTPGGGRLLQLCVLGAPVLGPSRGRLPIPPPPHPLQSCELPGGGGRGGHPAHLCTAREGSWAPPTASKRSLVPTKVTRS